MTHMYFVRHAEPNYENHDDRSRELSSKGLADRPLVTGYLRDKGVTAVLSSPYRRAVDTVSPLADTLGLPVETVDGFRERKVDSGWIEDFRTFSQRQWQTSTTSCPTANRWERHRRGTSKRWSWCWNGSQTKRW